MFGVNLSGAEFGNPNGQYGWSYTYPTASELQYYAGKGVDFVRLPFLWERIEPTLGGPLSQAELGRMETFLSEAQATGTKVLLDLHDFGGYDGNKLGTSATPISDFEQVWTQLAKALQPYASAIAGYDIMNEPSGMASSTWTQSAQAAIDGIRSVDTTTAIYVEGNNYANSTNYGIINATFSTLSDPNNNIVYEAHIYFDANDSGTYQNSYTADGTYAMIGVDRLRDFETFLQQNHAQGYVGEYSIPNDDARYLAVMENFLSALAKDGIPSTYWGAGPWWGNYPESIEPQNGVDSVQMGVLEQYITAVANHTFSSDLVFPHLMEGVDVRLLGGAGSLGIIASDLVLHGATQATLSVDASSGGFQSTLGYFTVAANGTIDGVNFAFENSKANIGNQAVLNLGTGADTSLGLFMIANGNSDNHAFAGLNLSQGTLNFYYDYGHADQRVANINDSGTHLSLIFTDASGHNTQIEGATYFATDRGSSAAINFDDSIHVVSGLANATNQMDLQIGFEDLPNGGDRDYNDTIVDLSFLPSIASYVDPTNANSIVDSNANGAIAETLTGGYGVDTFVITAGQPGADEIQNFNPIEGDKIDIRDVLVNYDPTSALLSAFVEATQVGNNTVISVNPMGNSSSTFTPVAIIDNTHADLTTLVANHNLVVH